MYNKNDPLVHSVKAIMEQNERRRQVEKKLCEELGIYSRKQLPREHLANYDTLLEQRMKEELIGNQHKIDANKNNKVDAHDFKLLRAKKSMQEQDDGEETREGGAVTRDGKPVVSPTATRAGESSARRPASEGPSASERQALTNMIKKDVVKEEEQLDELSKKFLMKASDAAEAKGRSLAGKAPRKAAKKLKQANDFYNAATSGDYRYGPKGSGAKITRTMRKNDPYDDMEKHSPRDIKEEQLDEAGMNLKAFGKNANRDYPAATKSGGEIARGLKKGVKSASTDWLKNVSKNADKAADFSPAKLQGRMAKRELDKRMKKEEVEQLDEKITKSTSAGEVISDFVHSKNPKFAGKSKKERMKMALGAYYSKHPEKSNKMNENFDLDAVMEEIARNLGEDNLIKIIDKE